MGCLPTGNSFSCVGPAIGRLMLAKRPPLPLFQTQTFGGTYPAAAVVSAMACGSKVEVPGVTLADHPALAHRPASNTPMRYVQAWDNRGERPNIVAAASPYIVNTLAILTRLARRPKRDRFAERTALSESSKGNDMTKHLSGAEHHLAAATHHEQAAAHHRLASQHYAEKDYAHAAHQALIAHGHGQQAARHANEATKYHIEHHDAVPPPLRVVKKIEPVQ